MSVNLESKETVPCFESVPALQDGLASKRAFEAVDLYPRDGSVKLCELEERVGRLAGVHGSETVLFASGMTAVTNTIEVGLSQKTEAQKQPTIAFGAQVYSQTRSYQDYLRERGVKIREFDSGSRSSVAKMLENHQPDVVFSETVANGPDMPVLDIDHLKEQLKYQENPPLLILDNTLPLSTGLPLSEELEKEDDVVVVESGTKSYTFNNELLGIAYSKNQELVDALRKYRRTVGTMPGKGNMEAIGGLLPESKDAFDDRNLRLLKNAGALAVRLHNETNGQADFIVTHPAIDWHDNHELALHQHPKGSAPLLFLQCTGEADQFDLANRIWSNDDVRKCANLGQSFGFDEARILPDEIGRTVRISSGAYTDVERLGDALVEAVQINDQHMADSR